MTEPKIFDLEGALERTENDKDFLFELIDLFFENYAEGLSGLKEALDSKNAVELQSRAHTMKGALANIGASAAAEICLALEKAGRENSLETGAELIAALEGEIEKFRLEAGKSRP